MNLRLPRLLCLLLPLLGTAPIALAEGLLDRLEAPKKSAQREFLPPDEAFVFTHQREPGGRLHLTWQIAPRYYLYREKFKIESPDRTAVVALETLPAGEEKDDDEFGKVRIFRDTLSAYASLQPAVGASQVSLKVTYQGCAEDGICYPPIRKTLTLPVAAAGVAEATPGPASPASTQAVIQPPGPAAAEAGGSSEVDRISGVLAGSGLPKIIASFLGFGLLLSLTPCVFPMVPIVSGLVVGEHGKASAARGLALSGIYVLAMAGVYALAGLLAGLFGRNLQAAFQHPVALGSFSAVFVVLALSMFGFFHLQLPAGLRQRLHLTSQNARGGSLAGAAVMGGLSAVIVGPCVAPPLAGALLYLGQQGSPVVGGLALFALGLGMGVPLLLVGASAGHFLPRAGAWLERVQHVFGVISLGVAVWFLGRILPPELTLALWAALCIGTGVFLGALEPVPETATGWSKLWKALGLGLLLYGAVLLVGAAAGADDLRRPLAPLTDRQLARAAETGPVFQPIKGQAGLAQAVARARDAGRPVVLDFYADWCIECKKLERETFENAGISAKFAEFTLLRADVTLNDAEDRALLASLSLFGPPAVLLFDGTGRERRAQRLVGFEGPEAFGARLDSVLMP